MMRVGESIVDYRTVGLSMELRMTQRIARGIEIANYIILLSATLSVAAFLRGPLIANPELLFLKFAPVIFFFLGLALHL